MKRPCLYLMLTVMFVFANLVCGQVTFDESSPGLTLTGGASLVYESGGTPDDDTAGDENAIPVDGHFVIALFVQRVCLAENTGQILGTPWPSGSGRAQSRLPPRAGRKPNKCP